MHLKLNQTDLKTKVWRPSSYSVTPFLNRDSIFTDRIHDNTIFFLLNMTLKFKTFINTQSWPLEFNSRPTYNISVMFWVYTFMFLISFVCFFVNLLGCSLFLSPACLSPWLLIDLSILLRCVLLICSLVFHVYKPSVSVCCLSVLFNRFSYYIHLCFSSLLFNFSAANLTILSLVLTTSPPLLRLFSKA